MAKVVQFPGNAEDLLKQIPLDEISEKAQALFDALKEAEIEEMCFNFDDKSFLVTRQLDTWRKIKP